MPIYEYRCPVCGRKWSKVWMKAPVAKDEASLRCRSCGGEPLQRLFSTFSKPKSEEQRLESLAEGSSLDALHGSNPRDLARFMRRVSEETGEPLEGEDEDMIQRMEAGEMPDDESGPGNAAGGEEFL